MDAVQIYILNVKQQSRTSKQTVELQFIKMSSPKFSPEQHNEEKDREISIEKEEKPSIEEEEFLKEGQEEKEKTGQEEKEKTEKVEEESPSRVYWVSKKRKGGVGYSMFI